MWTRFDQKDLDRFLREVVKQDIDDIQIEVGAMAIIELETHRNYASMFPAAPREAREALLEQIKFAFSAGAKFGALYELQKCIDIFNNRR